jgi:hypothetical protein
MDINQGVEKLRAPYVAAIEHARRMAEAAQGAGNPTARDKWIGEQYSLLGRLLDLDKTIVECSVVVPPANAPKVGDRYVDDTGHVYLVDRIGAAVRLLAEKSMRPRLEMLPLRDFEPADGESGNG